MQKPEKQKVNDRKTIIFLEENFVLTKLFIYI